MAEERERRSTSVAEPMGREDRDDGDRRRRGPKRAGVGGPEAVRRAREQFSELTGHPPDSVSALSRTEHGWLVRMEVVEVEKIPPTTSVMGSYEVAVDEQGELQGYELVQRYHRGQVGGEES